MFGRESDQEIHLLNFVSFKLARLLCQLLFVFIPDVLEGKYFYRN